MFRNVYPATTLTRRQFLQRAGLGCGSLALLNLLYQEGLLDAAGAATGARPSHFPARAKQVIWLFMTGGPSQVDTFDYKPELQRRHGQPLAGADKSTGFFQTSGQCLRSPFGWKQHGRSGSWVSDIFPHLARHVDEMAFLHSCYVRGNNHAPASMELTCGQSRPGYPSLGAWLGYGLGSLNQSLPSFVVMHETRPRGEDGIWSPGFLPKNYQPLLLDARQLDRIPNLGRDAAMADAQQRAQLEVLRQLNEEHRQRRPLEADLDARIQSFELAYRMQTAAPEAVDVARETQATRRLYGLDNPQCAVFGRQCLIARRLVERGVRFVQIFAGRGTGGDGSVADVPWDGHSNIEANHRSCALATDQPAAALLTDLKARGLLDSTLVVWGGEFGRTSDSQGSVGRDHNPHANTIWLAGGGVRGGVHHGRTDDFGYKAVVDRVHVNDLHATILHLLGLDHTRLTYRFNGRDFRLTDVGGEVIRDVLAS